MKKGFDSEPVYNDNWGKILWWKNKHKFHTKKMLKEGTNCFCFSMTLKNSVIKMDKRCYPQIFLEKCKYNENGNKISKFIDKELELDFSDESDYSDEFNEESGVD